MHRLTGIKLFKILHDTDVCKLDKTLLMINYMSLCNTAIINIYPAFLKTALFLYTTLLKLKRGCTLKRLCMQFKIIQCITINTVHLPETLITQSLTSLILICLLSI